MNARTCIVTRIARPADELIRFVASPEGRVVADLKHELPGRGCWVTAGRGAVAKAVKRKLFARALRIDVAAPDDLGDEIDRVSVRSLLGMMSLARKAGQFVGGAAKVDAAVRGGQASAVFHALDAADDGIRKIDQARHARCMSEPDGRPIPVFRLLDAAQMHEGLGEGALIHCATLAGQAGQGVVKRAIWLDRYRHGEHGAAVNE